MTLLNLNLSLPLVIAGMCMILSVGTGSETVDRGQDPKRKTTNGEGRHLLRIAQQNFLCVRIGCRSDDDTCQAWLYHKYKHLIAGGQVDRTAISRENDDVIPECQIAYHITSYLSHIILTLA